MELKLAVLAGDGIGTEVIAAGTKVLEHVGRKFGHVIKSEEGVIGWAALDAGNKTALLKRRQKEVVCAESDAIFFGAVGLPDRDKTLPLQEPRPERVAALELRKGLFANLRHIVLPREFGAFVAVR